MKITQCLKGYEGTWRYGQWLAWIFENGVSVRVYDIDKDEAVRRCTEAYEKM